MPRSRRRPAATDPEVARWAIPIEVDLSRDAKLLKWRYQPTRPVLLATPPPLDRALLEKAVADGRVPASLLLKAPRTGPRRLSPEKTRGVTRTARATAGMLVEFLDFGARELPAGRIRDFARRFGVFHHHGRPGADGSDDVVKWRDQARQFAGLLAMAEEMRQGRPVPVASFLSLVQAHVADHVRLRVESRLPRGRMPTGVGVVIGGGSLLGALCAEVLRELQGNVGRLVPCGAGCGRVVPLVQAGRRAFCQSCRRHGMPVVMAKQDLSARRTQDAHIRER